MPREHARTWVEIVTVKPARGQEITEEEMLASGLTPCNNLYRLYPTVLVGSPIWSKDAREGYAAFWDRLNARKGFPWVSNPWTWRCTLKLCEAPK
jgi:hypothetical protein